MGAESYSRSVTLRSPASYISVMTLHVAPRSRARSRLPLAGLQSSEAAG